MPNLPNLSKRTTNSLNTDFKAEVIAASLIEQGVDPDSVTIIRKGIARRGVSTEVESVYQKFSDYDLLEYLCIDTIGGVLVISPGHSDNHNFNGSAVS